MDSYGLYLKKHPCMCRCHVWDPGGHWRTSAKPQIHHVPAALFYQSVEEPCDRCEPHDAEHDAVECA